MPSEREQRALDALIVSQLRTCEDDVDVELLPELTDEERDALDSFGPKFVDNLLAGKIQSNGDEADDVPPEDCKPAVAEEEVFGLNRAEEIDEETKAELDEKRKEIIDRIKREEEDGRFSD